MAGKVCPAVSSGTALTSMTLELFKRNLTVATFLYLMAHIRGVTNCHSLTSFPKIGDLKSVVHNAEFTGIAKLSEGWAPANSN
jgi:hypothetical protein